MHVSIVISTYNKPVFLRNTLMGYTKQTHTDFEVVVADDGSTDETREMLDAFRQTADFAIEHCWHEDDGFRKTMILNRAISKAKGDYIIFTDGDCIPRDDFVAVHVTQAEKGRFLSGGVEYLSKAATEALTDQLIESQQLFDPTYIAQNREKPQMVGKVNRNPLVHSLVKTLSPVAATFNGHNASTWAKDVRDVNGFDERMAYGGLDRELGERLENAGIKGKSVRYDAIIAHQWHSRPYATKKSWSDNHALRAEVKSSGTRWTEWGIIHGPAPKDGADAR